MSAKRPATTDLNHTNWNDEVEPEERGEFRLAPEEEINKRVIKKARRRVTTASAAGAGDDVADSSSSAAVSKSNSVFGNFAGFGANAAKPAAGAFSFLSKIPAVAASATSISSSGLTAPPAAAKPMFSFAAKPAASAAPNASTASTTTIATKPTFSFGNPTTAASTTTITLSSSSSESSSNSTSLPDIPQSTTPGNVVKKSSNYCAKLKVLNKVVSDWIKSKVDDNPTCLLTPIFKEYEGYLNEIEAEEANETKAPTEKKPEKTEKALTDFDNKTAPTSTAPKLTFGAVGGNSVGTTPKSGSFLFGNLGSSPAKSTDSAGLKTNGSIFGNATGSGDAEKPSTESAAKTSTFSFGFAKPAASTSVTSTDANTTSAGAVEQKKLPFSFSGGAPSFSFGNIKPLAAPMPSAAEASKEDDDDDEEPPKEEIKPVVEDDAVYSKKCKVFVKHDSSGYADRGVGTLYLKPVPGSNKKQLVVRAETNLGKILLNLILNEAVPTQRTGKNNVMLVCVPTPEEKKSSTVLVRVKTSEDADELLETIEKYKK